MSENVGEGLPDPPDPPDAGDPGDPGGPGEAGDARMGERVRDLNTPSVDFLLLADRAEAINGKLYVMGGAWETVFVQNFGQPILLSMAIGLLVPWNATNVPHALRITIDDLDGRPVGFHVDAGFTTGRPPFASPGDVQRTILAVPAVAQAFPGAGRYTVRAYIDGELRKTVPFRLVDATAGPAGAFPAPPG